MISLAVKNGDIHLIINLLTPHNIDVHFIVNLVILVMSRILA